MDIILLCLLVAVYFDIILFKCQDDRLFAKIFKISAFKAVLGVVLILTALVFSQNKWDDFPVLIFIFVMPMYLLHRDRCVRSMGARRGEKSNILLSSALGVIIVWTYGVLTFSLFTAAISDLFPGAISEMGDLILSAMFSSGWIFILIYRSSRHFSDQGFLTNIGLRRKSRSWVKEIALPIVLGLSFAYFSSYLALARQVQPQTPLSEILDGTQSLGLVLIFLFLAIGIAPLLEEIVFRGYFFRIIKEWLGGRKALYIISLTFAFLHVGQYWGDGLAIVIVTTLGFTLTILRAASGSTIPGVIAHYVYNGSVTVIPVIMIAISNPAYLEYKAYYPYYDAQKKEALLKESIAKQPDFSDAYNDLAWLYAEEEINLESALDLADKALRYAPEHPAYLDTKAEVLRKLGRFEEAERIIKGRGKK